MADNGLLFADSPRCKDRFEVFKEKLVRQCHRYPQDYLVGQHFAVIYLAREANHRRTFFGHMIAWTKSEGWSGAEIELPQASNVLWALGSGAKGFNNRYTAYEAGPTKGTSRAVFHCFCNTLFSGEDPLCGGAPQLVGIYRKPDSVGIAFGIIRDKKRYLYGAEVDQLPIYSSVEWRNDLFERCDGASMKLLSGAQEQPDPLRSQ
jgi:hypothetical protein